ncbi:MAG: hypothetical protein CL457_03315 [Acidimicrobiaceae bacterium]|nr:hypothetical protein [Acidimicrobiaceae bacterium]
MLLNLILFLLLGSFAIIVAYIANNRRTDSPSVPKGSLPIQVDRRDFDMPDMKWLLVFFSSESCSSCIQVREILSGIPMNSIHIQEVSFPQGNNLHSRYAINSVPIVLIANLEGVVIWSYAGVPPTDLIESIILTL